MTEKQIIGIIGAMKEEITPLLKYYKTYEIINYAENQFYKIETESKIIIIAQSKIGKVFAAITSTILIEKFKCSKILFTGVAGAINPKLKVGDIIMGEKLCQHDFDITSFGHPHGHIPGIELFINSDENLMQIANQVAKENNIDLKKGIIATGDQFIADYDKKTWIERTFSADAIEMEGASVAQVCKILNIPFFILRSISDSANGSANENFEEFMEKSAKISAKFLTSIINKI